MRNFFLSVGGILKISILFISLFLFSCASTQEINRINELAERRKDQGLFLKPPMEGEVNLGLLQDRLTIRMQPTISSEEAISFQKTNKIPESVNLPAFLPHQGAARLLIQAKKQFPDINIEDLDVRSLEFTSDASLYAVLGSGPISNSSIYTLYIVSEVNIQVIIVKRSPKIDYSVFGIFP